MEDVQIEVGERRKSNFSAKKDIGLNNGEQV
jgi:hypothetical protein